MIYEFSTKKFISKHEYNFSGFFAYVRNIPTGNYIYWTEHGVSIGSTWHISDGDTISLVTENQVPAAVKLLLLLHKE